LFKYVTTLKDLNCKSSYFGLTAKRK